jgi:hydroxyacylglutathione hydrolase
MGVNMPAVIHPKIKALEIPWEGRGMTIGAYLVNSERKALVDTGPPQPDAAALESVLQPFGLTLAQIDFALNTHGHLDHIGGNALLKEKGRARIVIHKEDADFIEDHSRSYDRFYASSSGPDAEKQKAGFLQQMGPELKVDQYIEDGDVIDLGDGVALTVIHLPGHTAGSVGFYWEREGILLCGDSIPGLNTPGGALPIIYDLAQYERSVERLMQIPLRCMLFSHPYRGLRLAPSTVRPSEEIKEYLADSLDIARRLRAALRRHSAAADERPLAEVADAVIAELPSQMGYKRVAELGAPQFTLGTVARGLALMKAAAQ